MISGALEVLVKRKAWSDVVRESQEVVELALKGMLRAVGIDPPKWHDVGDLLVEYADKISVIPAEELTYLAKASKRLRKEREFSFYGDVDFIPTEEYSEKDGRTALEQAKRATLALGKVLQNLRKSGKSPG